MKIILFQDNWIILSILTIIFTIFTVFIQNKILIQILKIEKAEIKRTYLIQVISLSIIKILLPIPYHKIVGTIIRIIIYKKCLNLRLEKALFSEKINVINLAIIELIIIKIYADIYKISSANETILLLCMLITIIAMYEILYLIIKRLNFSIYLPEYISDNSKKQIIEVVAISIFLIIIDEICVFNCIEEIPNIIYLLDVVLILAYYIISSKSIIKTLQIEKDKNAINELEGNNDRLMKNYDDISSFRHDFKNIMQGFGGFIVTKDMDGLKKMYNDIICECHEINNANSFSKDIINNPAVYNLINNKYLEAKKFGVEIKLEVYLDVSTLNIKTYELCRILGVLIDNAIEASKECDEKVISIKFIKDNYNNRNLIVIENTCKNYLVDINKIKEKGFTTKKNKLFHGLGLWRVNKIVGKNENLRLYTSRDKMFKQQLEIYTWN